MVNIHRVIDWDVPDIPKQPDAKQFYSLIADISMIEDADTRTIRDIEFCFDDVIGKYDLLLQRIETDDDCKRTAIHAIEDLLRFVPNHLVVKLGKRQMEIEAWLGKQNIDCELIHVGDVAIFAFLNREDLILTRLYMGEEVIT
jgi:hypothetical protein